MARQLSTLELLSGTVAATYNATDGSWRLLTPLGSASLPDGQQDGYYVDSGTWSLSAGTGVYVGVSGGGRFVAVVLPSGRLLSRQEGFVRAS